MTDPTALLALGAATLGESGGLRMASRLRAAWPRAAVAGPAYSVRCTPGDNLAVHVAVTTAPPGSVLCVDVGEVRELGYWGEVLTTAAEARGLAGLVIDGCVRDVDALEAHRFPVFSAGIALTGASKDKLGEAGGRATVGDVEVATGDWLVADRDGVVAIRREDLDTVLAAARLRVDRESAMFTALRSGATTVELLHLDPTPVRVVPPPVP